jgi:4-amino-4-deoxy-L-arabinose transferase-like glycosyltransferase
MIKIARDRPVCLAVPVILLFFWLALNSMIGDSPTMDEQNHLARGLAFLRTGDPRFSLEHPPLINSISALPLLTLPEIVLPTDHESWTLREGWYAFAEQLLWIYNQDVERMIFLARMPILYLTLALSLVGYRFALNLWGRIAALLALIFLLLDPNILAHGRYSTTDVGGALFLLLATFLLWRLWTAENAYFRRLLVAGIALGLALSSKMSVLVFIPVFALLAILPLYARRWSWSNAFGNLLKYSLALLIAVIVVWGAYGFEWGHFRFLTSNLNLLNDLTGPAPTYLAGIEQIAMLSGEGRPAVLFGQFSSQGWWYYFPVAFAVKTPLMVLLLFVFAASMLLSRRKSRPKAIYLLLPTVLFFIFSMSSALNIGYRHLLPILPFLYVLASGVGQLVNVSDEKDRVRILATRFVVLGALFSLITITALLHPHYLSYFNILVGGPARGHEVLADSNIDWGQDLIRLKDWMVANNHQRVKLSWFGTADPAYYGIDYDPLPGLTRHFDLWWDLPFNPQAPEPGIYAISVSNLWELPLEDKSVFAWFREREPDAVIGYSIHVYIVDESNG